MENSEEKRGGYRENAGRPAKGGVRLAGSIDEMHDGWMRKMAEARGVANTRVIEDALAVLYLQWIAENTRGEDATKIALRLDGEGTESHLPFD